MKILRFIGAVALAIITSIAITFLAESLFGFTAKTFQDFGFWRLILFMLVLSIGSSILSFIVQLIISGFLYTVQGSKFISIIVILIFVNSFFNECVYLLGDTNWGVNSNRTLEMLKEAAGSFYTTGAVITLIIEAICYVALSFIVFIKPD